MAQELMRLVTQYGLLVVFFSAMVEQVGLPIPALPVLVVAGAAAAHGQLPWIGVVLAALAGCLLPDLMWYWVGRRFGGRVMHGLCRLSLSPDSCIHQSELHFERWRGRSLLFAKFVPGLSTVAPPLVGALGLRMRSFLLLDGVGAMLWVAIGVGLGQIFARQIDHVLVALADVGRWTTAAVVGLLALYIVFKWLRRRQMRVALQMTRATPAELHEALQGETRPLILDVRSQTSRQLDPWAIAGAKLVNPADLDALLRDVPQERELVIYCSCPNEATSAKIAASVKSKGFHHVRPLLGGLNAWKAAGHPVDPIARHDTASPALSLRPSP